VGATAKPLFSCTFRAHTLARLAALTTLSRQAGEGFTGILRYSYAIALPDPRRAWLVAAMTATLAGNLTILGSVANLIVVQRAARRGVTIGFWQYFRVGAPMTVLTILVGLWRL